MWYFGCWKQPGHYLFDRSGRTLYRGDRGGCPVGDYNLDGVYAPKPPSGEWEPEDLVSISLWPGKGGPTQCTILAMWDRSLDTRGGCNCAFIALGECSLAEMMDIAREEYPQITARLKAFQPEARAVRQYDESAARRLPIEHRAAAAARHITRMLQNERGR